MNYELKTPFSLLLMLLIIVCSCSEQKQKGGQTNYKTMTVERSDQTLTSLYTATLQGRQTVEIRPQVSGNIQRICIGEGDAVRKGQTLFVIDQVPYQAAMQVAEASVKSAEAKLATAQMEYDSSKMLEAGNVVSDYSVQTALNVLNEAKAALALAKAQALNARNNLGYTTVKSPVDGVASMIPYREGALVNSSISKPLVTVVDDHEVYAYFSMTENQVLDLIQQYGSTETFIRQAPEVELKLSNGTLYPVKGHIDAVSGTIDATTGAVSLRATFANAQHLLHHGGSATVIVPSQRKDVIVIPQESTYELQNRVFVYRVVDGKTKATPVEVFRLNNGTQYIVESGLNAGDTIIAEGVGLLKEGIEVKK